MSGSAERQRAVDMALRHRAETGAPKLVVGHRCTDKCATVGTQRVRVCTASLNVHVCPGQGCAFGRDTGEGTVCALSGFMIGGPSDTSTVSFTHSTGVTGTTTRHWGQSVRLTAKPAGRALAAESAQMTRAAIEHHVRLFLASTQRQEIADAEFEKVRLLCEKTAKLTRTPVFFADAVATVGRLYRERADLCAPAAPAGAPWLKTLALAILEFWRQFSDSIPMKKKNAPSFTAACLSFLASPDGLTIDGVVFIRPSPVVRLHSVLPRQFGLFRAMTCRRITQMTRQIKAALTLSSGQPRVVDPLDFA